MPSTHFALSSRWQIAAPIDQVWSALVDVESWPRWWPYVRQVRTLSRGITDGLGAVRRIDWSTRLPYGFAIEVESLEARRPYHLRGASRGQLQGQGQWWLCEHAGGTEVSYLWEVELARPWMRALSPLLARLFAWNHHGVMRAGERGLNRYLAHDAPDSRQSELLTAAEEN